MQASTRLGTSRGALVVFGVALLCRLLFVSLTTITPISDAERYAKQAERLLDGRGFTSDEGKPTAYTPPGYPFFLAGVQAALGREVRSVAYVQAVLGAVCCVFTFLVCHRLFGRRRALTAGLLIALSPTTIAYSGTMLSEIPATLTITAVLLVLVGGWHQTRGHGFRALFAGLLLGAGILVRPAIVGYGLGLGAWLLLRPGARLNPGGKVADCEFFGATTKRASSCARRDACRRGAAEREPAAGRARAGGVARRRSLVD